MDDVTAMEDSPERNNLVQILLQDGLPGLIITAFIIACTVWLLVSRIRGCFRPQPQHTGRDFAFLLSGPVCFLLYSADRAMLAGKSIVQGGIDAEFGFIYGLDGAMAICALALLCFILGVVAFTLPGKSVPPLP